MQKLILAALYFGISFNLSGQEEVYTKKEQKQIQKQERQAAKEAENELLRIKTESMLQLHRFVLEADYLSDKSGKRAAVNSTINFIRVDSLKLVMQLGSNYGVGYNGVGGITIEGSVTKYDLKIIEGKKGKSYNLMLMVMSSTGNYDITLLINDIGSTDATIRNNTSGMLRYYGRLVPIEASKVYKGSTSY